MLTKMVDGAQRIIIFRQREPVESATRAGREAVDSITQFFIIPFFCCLNINFFALSPPPPALLSDADGGG